MIWDVELGKIKAGENCTPVGDFQAKFQLALNAPWVCSASRDNGWFRWGAQGRLFRGGDR